MRRLNLKLLVWLMAATIVLTVGVHFLHGYQLKRSAGVLLTQAETFKKAGKTGEAAKRLTQFLKYRDDEEAYHDLATIVADIAEKPNASKSDRFRAFNVLEQAVRRYPQFLDLRRRLVDVTMHQGRFVDAMQHLDVLVRIDPKDATLSVKYALCLAMTGQDDRAIKKLYELVGFDEATQKFSVAKARGANQIDAYTALAEILRIRREDPKRADLVMDQLVLANKQNWQAYMERGRYRQRFAAFEYSNRDFQRALLDQAEQDYRRALELSPDEINAILAAANLATAKRDFSSSKGLLDRALQLNPKNDRIYLALSSLASAQEKLDESTDYIKSGIKAVPESSLLWSRLVELQLTNGDKEGARRTIDVLKTSMPKEEIEYLRAWLSLVEGKWQVAARELERLRPLLAVMPGRTLDVDLRLGVCYQNLNQPDRAREAFQRALSVDPNLVPALVGLTKAYNSMGKPAPPGIERLGNLTTSVPTPARTTMLRNIRSAVLNAKITDVLQRPAADRDAGWKETETLAARLFADDTFTEVQKTVLGAEILSLKGEIDAARRLLTAAKQKHPKDVSLWIALANLTSASDHGAKVFALLDEAEREVGDVFLLQLARLNAISRLPAKEIKPALARLEQGLDRFSEDDRVTFQANAGTLYHRFRDYDNATRCFRYVADKRPDDVQTRVALFSIAMDSGDEKLMKSMLEEVRNTDRGSGQLRLCETMRLIWQVRNNRADVAVLAQARGLLREASKLRPEWHEIPRLSAEIDELEGKYDDAIDNYKRAQELGPINPQSARRLVMLLYQRNRILEAKDALKHVGVVGPSDLMTKYAGEINLKAGDIGTAVDIAEKAVVQDPNNAENQLFYAQMLEKAHLSNQAEQAYRRALELNPKLAAAWIMLVGNLVTSGQPTEAERQINRAREALTGGDAPLVLAQCYELIGDASRAEESYLSAEKAKPKDLSVMRNVAAFYLRSNRPLQAEAALQRMIDTAAHGNDRDRDNIAWARRNKATILANARDYRKTLEALKLLQANAIEGKLPLADLLPAASILAARPEQSSKRKAIEHLERLQDAQPLTPQEQLMLAQLYDQTDQWTRALDQMTRLLSVTKFDPAVMAVYATMQVKRKNFDEAASLIKKLQDIHPNAATTIELQARLLAHQGKMKEAVEQLQRLAPRPFSRNQLTQLAMVADRLEELGQFAPAEELLAELARQQPRTLMLLATFKGRHGNVDEAFALCEDTRKSQPLVIVANIGLDILRRRPGEVSQKHFTSVRKWIEKGLSEEPGSSTELQILLAELEGLEGHYNEVVAIYRAVLKQSGLDAKQEALIMNNLAFILATRGEHAGDAEEARKLVDKSIEVLGPTSDVLDTRGMVRLANNDMEGALADLNEAVADTPSASKYVHLAQAQQKARNRAAAMDAIRQIEDRKLDTKQLSPLDRPAYNRLVKELALK